MTTATTFSQRARGTPAGQNAAAIAPGNVRIGLWGQSNAIGRASRSEISASPLTNDPALATFDAGTFSRVYIWTGSAFALLQPSVNNRSDAGDFGPEFGLAVAWMRETKSGNLYIEKNAYSGVSVTYFDPTTGPNGYSLGTTERGQQATWLTNNSVTLDAEALIWIQGEADDAQTQGWYQPKLEAMLAQMETDGFIGATSKIVLSQMLVGSSRYGAGVAAAKTAIAAADPTRISAFSFPPYIEADNLHYDARGQINHAYDCFAFLFGTRAAQI